MLTCRVGPKVTKERYDALDDALEALAAHVTVDARSAPRRSVLGREYEPGAQVAGRFELRGPGARGGVDVRGDGSAEAYTGRIRKRAVVPEGRETAVQALGRVLRGS